ncbi:MAG: hypothetical protein LIO56_02910 [Lachnospiraceae bacterium]|nr:hypothetical protein [Lachnospiraceae bacterium]
MKLKKWIFSTAVTGCIVCIGPLQAFAASSSEIQAQIESYMEDLEASQKKSEELEGEISSKQEEVGTLYAEVESLNIEREFYYQEMKTRIAYFYEESQGTTLLGTLLGSKNFAELISRIQFQQSLYEYDSARLDEYRDLVGDLEDKKEALDAELDDLGDMVEEQVVLQATLNATISDKESELADAKAAEAAAAAAAAEAAAKEAEKRASTDALDYAMTATTDSSDETETAAESESKEEASAPEAEESSGSQEEQSSSSEQSSQSPSSSGAVSESGTTSGGQLTRSKGVVYYNGHRETWYSTSEGSAGVVVGIPGRYTGSDGIIRDGDGYICVASSDYPKGTIVETSLGTGKVYDTGCASGTIDIYTEW